MNLMWTPKTIRYNTDPNARLKQQSYNKALYDKVTADPEASKRRRDRNIKKSRDYNAEVKGTGRVSHSVTNKMVAGMQQAREDGMSLRDIAIKFKVSMLTAHRYVTSKGKNDGTPDA